VAVFDTLVEVYGESVLAWAGSPAAPGPRDGSATRATTVRQLASVDYQVLSGDRYDERRIPTLPHGGLRIRVTSGRSPVPQPV
jgi:hypothetical protein